MTTRIDHSNPGDRHGRTSRRLPLLRAALAFGALLCATRAAPAQDLYDTTILRTINLAFHDGNWWTLLQQNYTSGTNILADLQMDGVTYPSVGVRIRGNTSYTALPAGSQKISLDVEMDYVDPAQTLLGYNSLNLNNGFHDPTFCREVVYNNLVAQFMPNPRANHVQLSLNGQNWGVYINVQQYNKDLLREWFADEDGLRIKCANNPNGPGLTYAGTNHSSYSGYEIKDDGGLADPYGALIAVCNSVTNEPLGSWQNIDTLFAIDPSAWSVVLENLFTDDDSYVNKGADFMLYRNPADGRMHLHQTDANETFTAYNWSPTMNFTASNKPVLSHVLAVPELRQRYMAHLRSALQKLDWNVLNPIFTAHRNLIAAAVQADPKKLYSYQLFQDNFTTTVTLPYSGPAGGTLIGLQQFVTQRRALVTGNAEVVAAGPLITNVHASSVTPAPGASVWITANVQSGGSGVGAVELFYRPAPGSFLRATMLDDGLSGDGAAADGVYGVLLPLAGTGGQKVEYYVAARSGNTYQSFSFAPERTEIAPLSIEYTPAQSTVRITEYMYQGLGGEFFELTNVGLNPVDLTGWSMDDDSAIAGTLSLSGAGILAPGQSLVVTDVAPAAFAASWGLSGVTILGPNTQAALGRNDQINVYDASGSLVERLSYGDETFAGSIRTKEKSGQLCSNVLGQDDALDWVLAGAGDAFGSHLSSAGDVGDPGHYAYVSCHLPIGTNYCSASPNMSGTTAAISATGSTTVSERDVTLAVAGANPNVLGVFIFGSAQAQFPFGFGTLCIGGSLQRVSPPAIVGASGSSTRTLDFNASYAGLLLPGTTQNFQFWYRDNGVFNLSDGLSLVLH